MTSRAAPPSQARSLMRLHDLDMLLRDYREDASRAVLEGTGFRVSGLEQLRRVREELAQTIEPRWLRVYERALQRHGRAVVPVMDRVCMGCFVTLPTSIPRPAEGSEEVLLCQSCGRFLYWL
ncbi:MAG: hypothetical protein HZC42_01910 [Candidatus Eisenbacteria bacterium]|nr:hypothetical protein [Candidatus Eisenbacteria bacterium]